jgi:uncharacterized protein (TIRG00374 family)
MRLQAVTRPMDLLRRHRLLFQLLVGLIFLSLLAWQVDVVDAVRRIHQVNPWWVLLGTATFALATIVEGWRWWVILSYRTGVPRTPILLLYAISRMANVLLPIRGGDLVRIQIAASRFKISRTELAATIFAVETPLNWVTSLAFLFAALSILELPVLRLPYLRGHYLLAVTLLLLAGFVGFMALSHAGRARHISRIWPMSVFPEHLRHRIDDLFQSFLDGMESLRRMHRLVAVLGLSFLIWVAQAAMFWCFGQAFGLGLRPVDYALVTIGTVIVRTFPLSPGDIGPYEFVVSRALILLGVDPNAAAGYAIGVHLWLLTITCGFGLLGLWALNLSLSDLIPASSKTSRKHGFG